MEKLCNSFDLNTPHISSISTKYPTRPTSSLAYTSHISCSNGSRHQKFVVQKTVSTPKNYSSSQLDKTGDSVGLTQGLVKGIGRGLVGFAAALAVCVDSPALAQSLTVAFPVSPAHEVLISWNFLLEYLSLSLSLTHCTLLFILIIVHKELFVG